MLKAGIAILIVTIASPFSELYVYPKLIVPGKIAETVKNIIANVTLFRARIFCYMITFTCDILADWARWIMPPVYGLLFASYGLFVWWLSFRLRTNAVIIFCICGGLWGILTHIWAIYRGILEKPPMLSGADPVAAVVIAAFEFIFYWCVCLSLTFLTQQIEKRLR